MFTNKINEQENNSVSTQTDEQETNSISTQTNDSNLLEEDELAALEAHMSDWLQDDDQGYRETLAQTERNAPWYEKAYYATIDEFKSIRKSIVGAVMGLFESIKRLYDRVIDKVKSIVNRDGSVKKSLDIDEDFSLTKPAYHELVQEEMAAVAMTLGPRLPSYKESQSGERGNPPSYEEAVKAGKLEISEQFEKDDLKSLDHWEKTGLEPTSAYEFQGVIVEPNKQTVEPFVSLEAATPSYTDRSYVRYNDNTALQGVIVEPNKQTAEPFVSLEAATPSYPANSSARYNKTDQSAESKAQTGRTKQRVNSAMPTVPLCSTENINRPDTLNVALHARRMLATLNRMEKSANNLAKILQEPNSSLDGHVRTEHPKSQKEEQNSLCAMFNNGR